jgi:hypothetical protein
VDIEKQVAEILYLSDYNTTSKYHCDELADQIHALYTVTSIWLECDACGGRGEVRRVHPRAEPGDKIYFPCTCKDGKREWRVYWNKPAEHQGATGWEKPLHATDAVSDNDITYALAELRDTGQRSVNITNNKGRLVLKEVK